MSVELEKSQSIIEIVKKETYEQLESKQKEVEDLKKSISDDQDLHTQMDYLQRKLEVSFDFYLLVYFHL